jgi:hypothetical protein
LTAHQILPAGVVLPPMPRPEVGTPDGEPRPASSSTSIAVLKVAGAVTSDPTGLAAPPAKIQPRGGRIQSGEDRGRPDRFRVLNDFVDGSMRDVGDGAAKAWFVLYRDTKPDGLARTGLSDMATRMGCSVSTAKRAVRALRKRGLLTLVRKGAPGVGPNVYRVLGTPAHPSPTPATIPV